MQKRSLGKSGIEIAPIALGGNVFGWTTTEEMSFRLLDQFVDAGFNLIDTADMYSNWVPGHVGGESETVIGRWLKKSGKRNQVVIATKVGMEFSEAQKGLKAKYIQQAVEDSLKRLQVDVIDLYQTHEDDLETPVEETLMALDSLVKAGKVRAIGASQYTPERLRESLETSRKLGIASYTCLQPLYNLYDRENFEQKLAPICKEYSLGVISYYALAAGFLTGKYRSEKDLGKSMRGTMRIPRYMNERGLKILAALDQVAESMNTTPASIAVAWVISNPTITAPIASATNPDQLVAILRASDIVLDTKALSLLNEASN